MNKYLVTFNGKPVYYLNESLAKRQGITDKELENLIRLHEMKLFLFSRMKVVADKEYLRDAATIFKGIEFAMQRNWRFPEDEAFHEWYTVPQCSCPKMDNFERRGTGRKIVNLACIIHGN